MYHVIGDVHGHADALRALLGKLGYHETAGAWRHPQARAIFVGDLIDRGPRQVETVAMVRAMVDAGSAIVVMGNHEYNALMWAAPDPERPGAFMRPHSAKNRNQHRDYLAQVGEGSSLHRDHLAFFASLPLWLDLPDLRVVHACWHPAMMDRLRPHLEPGNVMPAAQLVTLGRKGSATEEALEILLKGVELTLPGELSFIDKDGHRRREVRLRWWAASGAGLREAALGDDDLRAQLPDAPVPPGYLMGDLDGPPILFGHYWMHGAPILTSPRAACLDWSVARGGVLAAYRFEGEPILLPERIVSVA